MKRMFARAVGVFGIILSAAAANEIDPIGAGPFEVACTNLEVTPKEGAPMFDFLNGKEVGKDVAYLTGILTHPDAVPTVTVPGPVRRHGANAQVNPAVPVVLLVMYPTARNNPRPDYTFPYRDTGDKMLPHMQRPGEKPLFPEAGGPFPLIVNSGGYNTHALWHLEHLKRLASHGYIVLDIQHGDGRFGFFEGMALRPLEFKAALDWILQSPDFQSHVDADRIGAAGQSAGGHTILMAMGGVDPQGRIPRAYDSRIKAGFGLVPAMGGSLGVWPFALDAWFFGEDHSGLRQVRKPFFAVYGEKDESVRAKGVEEGVRAISGSATAVMLDGETHAISGPANSDIYTWEVLFFAASLRGDETARQQLKAATSVKGGVHDHKTIEHAGKG